MKKLVLSIVLVVPMLWYSPHGNAMEWNIDRPGSDFSNFDLPAPNPELCQDRCAQDPKCKAWTYVKPNTIQGPNPRCWLKHAVPRKRPHTCCVSGVKAATPAPPASAMEWNIDRPGSDFSNFNLPAPNPELCQDRCAQDPKCKAWTYVKPNTIQGPNPRCWLKHAAPRKRPNNCCVSGVKAATPAPPASAMEWNIDRPGLDFSNFNLPAPEPEMCRDRCAQDPKCKAWTYVKPNTIQGPNPRCWLKHAVPQKRPNNCCVSGVK